MHNFWRIILAIAFALILLEGMVLLKKGNLFEFTWVRIVSIVGLAAVLYYIVFEYWIKKK